MDEGDMLATPLSKLPPPVLQSRVDDPLQGGGGNGGSAPSYQELMKDFTTPSRGAEYDPRPPSQSPMQNTQAGGHADDMYESSMQQQQMQQMQQQQMQYQQMQQQQHYPQQFQPNPLAYAMPAPTYTAPPPIALAPPLKKKLLSIDTLKNTRAWFAAISIFLFVWYVLPKIKNSVPALVSPLTGELSVPGVAAASTIAGLLIATISDHFLA